MNPNTIEFIKPREPVLPSNSTDAYAEANKAMHELEALFTDEDHKTIAKLPQGSLFAREFRALGLESETVTREEFFQLPWLWHRRKTHQLGPERWTTTGTVTHPLRSPVEPGIIYQRFIPTLGQTLRFERLEIDKHLEIFHAWQNQRRVAKFWELNQSKTELEAYLEKVHADPHHFPAIVSIDGIPSGYFEIYWAAEDRLGPYYDCQPYDRGFHFLIGEKRHLGRNYFNAFVESISHFLFLDEPRTRTLLAEPRADNIALLHYLEEFPYWEKLYEFDFPHKRAALLACRREDFFRKASFL